MFFCVMDDRWDDFVVGIFFYKSFFKYIFLWNQNFFSIFYTTVIFIYFYNVFGQDLLKISSVLNSPLPVPWWRAQSHIVLEYNNENMRFIRLLLANQIAHTFRSIVKRKCFKNNDNNNIEKKLEQKVWLICLVKRDVCKRETEKILI